MKTLITAALIATLPLAAAATPQDLASPAVATAQADFSVEQVKFGHGHFKKKAFKKGYYGGFAKKKFVGKKFKGGFFF